MKRMLTIQGVVPCGVPEFKPAEYKGLKSGIGRERRSSQHFNCKDKCCAVRVNIQRACDVVEAEFRKS